MEEVHHEWERDPVGAEHIRKIAHHYNVYRDLFKHGDFLPLVHMDIDYDCREEDEVNPVFYGNELLPTEVQSAPTVTMEADSERLYTLLLTNPDEHLEDNGREYAHWLIGNIPSCDVSKGDVMLDYLQPIPARGTGYHRMVFLLFQQEKEIDFTEEKRETPCLHLCDRDFSTFDFYRRHEDCLTPVSLRFFQCKWDDSVRETFHNLLQMPEPVYEFAKLSEKQRLSRLERNPGSRTLTWLNRFFPKEPIYPDGSLEERELKIQAAVDASSYDPKPNRAPYPLKNVY